MHQSIETEVKPTRQQRKLECVYSDRIGLAREANLLIGTLNREASSIAQPKTEQEESAYIAALGYLARQFHAGHCDLETVEVERETEWKSE